MKKLIAAILIIVSILSLASCDGILSIFDKGAKNTLSGVSLDKYSIVYSEGDLDYSKRAAEYIQSEIKKICGITLPLLTDDTEPSENEIVVGKTSRAISKKLDAYFEEINFSLHGLEFAVYPDEGSVALDAEYFVIAAAAYFFVERYIVEAGYEADIPNGVTVETPITKAAKNYILLIGDGMGLYQSKLYEYMENDRDFSDGEDIFYGWMLPYLAYSRTDSLTGTTDSAAAGTAMSTGYKTYNGCVGVDSKGNNLKLITELALSLGKGAGVMSTETSSGATPSAFSAHALSRNYKETIISEQTKLELEGLVIDCGYDYYTKKYMSVIESHITETLSAVEDEDGFFLMYEDAHIDKHSAKGDMEKTFDSLVRFNQAIARFMEYAFYNPETMVIITADHETGSLLPGEDGKLSYGSEDHSSADVPLFAYGAGAEIFDGKTIENIQIAQTLASFMGVYDFGDQSEYQYLGKK